MLDNGSYNQAALDSQYNTRLHVPHFQDYLDRWERQSREEERAWPVVKDIPYGELPRERLDVYSSSQPQSKTLIFLHGGWWHLLDKALFHFIAGGFRRYGITTVFPAYPLAPGSSIDEIVQSCQKAIAWLYHHISGFNGDPHQLYVAGHSAGGHLAAMLVATDWSRSYPSIPANVLKGACFVSGLFDLLPIQRSYLNTVLGMDKKTAIRNSPVQHEPLSACPMIVAVGEAETTAFHDQSKALYEGWREKGNGLQLLSLPGLDHYSVVDAMTDPNSELHAAICRLMGL